jgi:hypothetical protein
MARIFKTRGIEANEKLYFVGGILGIISMIVGTILWVYGKTRLMTFEVFPFIPLLWSGIGFIMVIFFSLGYHLRPFSKDAQGKMEKLFSKIPDSYYIIKDFEFMEEKTQGKSICIDYLVINPNGIFIIKTISNCKVVDVAHSKREWERKKTKGGHNVEKKDLCSLTYECMSYKKALRAFLIKYKHNILSFAPEKLHSIRIEPFIVITDDDYIEESKEDSKKKNLAIPVLTLEEFKERLLKKEPLSSLSSKESLNLGYFLRRWAFLL